jgi:hypothetical protein
MIDKEDITLFKVWANEGSIFYDEYSQTFMLGTHNDLGESEFYRISPELTGLFSPEHCEDKERYSFCYGQLAINKAKINLFEPKPAKLFKVESFSYFSHEHHKNNLLAAISFASFHYRNGCNDEVPYISDAITTAKILNQKGNINEESALKAAVLKQIVISTHVRLESIEMLFGKQVKTIVELLTHINNCGDDGTGAMLKELTDASDCVKQVQLAIILTTLKYVSNLSGEKRQFHLSWNDQIARVCESASSDMFHLYLVERSKLN